MHGNMCIRSVIAMYIYKILRSHYVSKEILPSCATLHNFPTTHVTHTQGTQNTRAAVQTMCALCSLLCHTICTGIQFYLSTTVSGVGRHGNRGINIEGRSRQKFPEVSYGDDTPPVLQVTQLVEQRHLQGSDLSIPPCFSQQLA